MAENDTREMLGDRHGWVIVSREWGVVLLGMHVVCDWVGRVEELPLWSQSPDTMTLSPSCAPVFATLEQALEHAHTRFPKHVPGLDFKLVEGDVSVPVPGCGYLVYASQDALAHAGIRRWLTSDTLGTSDTVNKEPL